jgi:hypothetical protein
MTNGDKLGAKDVVALLLMTYAVNLVLLWLLPERDPIHHDIVMSSEAKNVFWLLSPLTVWMIAIIHLIFLLSQFGEWFSHHGVFG